MIKRIATILFLCASFAFAGQGMGPGPGAITYSGGGGGGITYVSQTATQTGSAPTTLSLTLGAGSVSANDILIMYVAGDSGVTPSGWTIVTNNGGDYIYYRRATGTGDAPTVTGQDDGEGGYLTFYARIFVFSGCYQTSSPFDVKDAAMTSASLATISGNSLTTGYDYSMVAMIAKTSQAVTAAGGGIDSYVAGDGTVKINIGYDSTPNAAGSQTAPTLTQPAAQAEWHYTFSLRKQ